MLKPPDVVSCAWVDNRLEAMAGDELSQGERSAVSAHASICTRCAEELAVALEIHRGLARLPVERCPQRVVDSVLAAVTAEAYQAPEEPLADPTATKPPPRWRAFLSALFAPSLRPAFTAAAVVALVVTATLWLSAPPREAPTETVDMTPEEIERAKLELQLTFAYLGRIGENAGSTVREEVYENVLAPTQRAFFAPPTPGQEDIY